MFAKIIRAIIILNFIAFPTLYAKNSEYKKISFDEVEKSKNKILNMQTTVFSQIVQFKIPKTWAYEKPAFEKVNNKTNYIAEYLPKNQNLNNWKEMLTIQGFKNLASKKSIKPESIIYMLAGNIKKISEKNFLFSTISKKSIDGYPAMIALIGCANLPAKHVSGIEKGQGEIGLYLCIKGNKDMYLVHKSWKTKAFNKDSLPITKTELKRWIGLLSKTKIIEKSKGVLYQ